MIRNTSQQDKVITKKPTAKKWLLAGLGGIGLLSAVALSIEDFSQLLSAEQVVSSQQLKTAQVVRGDMIQDIRVEGRTLAAVSPSLYAIASGTVTLHVKAGDSITAGQALASLDSPELRNQLLQEEATLRRIEMEVKRKQIAIKQQQLDNTQKMELAKVELEAAQSEMARANASIEKQIISKLELEQTMVELKRAELNERHAIESLKLSQEQLNFELQSTQLDLDRQRHLVTDLQRQVDALTLTSPLDGIVGNLNVQQKQHVQRDSELMSLVDLSELEVEAYIPENLADELGIGLKAKVQINNQYYLATLMAISPEVENGRVSGRIRFDQQPESLRQNQRVNAQIIISHKQNVLKVERGAFVETGSATTTYKIADGSAIRTRITLGAKSIREVEVKSGLQAGDTIVISSLSPFGQAQQVILSE
ncbi:MULTISPECIES: efflux RND transporter periplasmic adaptor subunit [Pseudoalteromonas]|uniref:HlyD family efflux transporter periplasmic adaptor subunit n=1 Tax=Pseudoalteromonas obscura TaxID=3048491 RepID=A0ABT7EGY2_9GAMM|nr:MULTISPECIES: HlyD family efflux transporter periplasmic adaptor subunit [Pseudoalteromonas]MBQ4835961.1 HlyD family efflux transporter periplasmic adaptor subunit [Pseudoalteromonas luteoviolacea]MDK2594312.1 HlyD family efflux transporter periplasmic adaptor subunit [Pseudoalteromonas sp. P94(2023)]